MRPPIEVELTWLLVHLAAETMAANFAIDRRHADTCWTPRYAQPVREGNEIAISGARNAILKSRRAILVIFPGNIIA